MMNIPISILIRESDDIRRHISFKHTEDVNGEVKDFFSLIGCSLLVMSGLLLTMSLGFLHHSWHREVKINSRPIRALYTLISVVGVIITSIGLRSIQKKTCDQETNDCHQ